MERRHIALACLILAATACGGTNPVSTAIGCNTTRTVGGTVSGMVGEGLTIELLSLTASVHGATVLEQIDIGANGSFVFRIPPAQGYAVVIVHQPHSPTQHCAVRNGNGAISTTNVTDVGIVCDQLVADSLPHFSIGEQS
jgi:hypothetical protein